jgi:hypothetical protein
MDEKSKVRHDLHANDHHRAFLFVVSVGEMTYKRNAQKEMLPKRLVTIENSSTPAMVSLRTVCC